jgi:hypothetical protein
MAGAAASMGARAVLRDKGVLFIGLGWGGFIAENLFLSENRTWIIEQFGETNYITVRACVRARSAGRAPHWLVGSSCELTSSILCYVCASLIIRCS